MDSKTFRVLLIELVGAFGLVFFSAGLVCINVTTQPGTDGAAPLTWHQPGAFGIALGQGLILAALLALTAPVTGGYLNPAITLMLWVFAKVETPRAVGLIVVQFLGGVLAALCLRYTFAADVLKIAHFGAPLVNPLAYLEPPTPQALLSGAAIELVLTFFLVFAIFGMVGVGSISTDPLRLALVSGMIATVCALFAFPLTGAALNPARWLGPTLFDAIVNRPTRGPWADALVYLAGPILGALLGGYFVFKVYLTPAEKK